MSPRKHSLLEHGPGVLRNIPTQFGRQRQWTVEDSCSSNVEMIVDPVASARANGGWPAMDPAHRQQRAAAPANLVQLEQSVRKLAIQEPVFVPPPVEYRLPPQPPPRRMAPEDAPGIDSLLSSSRYGFMAYVLMPVLTRSCA